MEFRGERLLPVSPATAWAALDDPALLGRAIPGCESIVPLASDAAGRRYELVIAVAVGPVKARIRGSLELVDRDPPHAVTLRFQGSGVAAGGRGSAVVRLGAIDAAATTLEYRVVAAIGGRATFGTRLVELAVRRVVGAFFDNVAKAMKERRA